jgi:hypothetical protein
VEPVVQRSAAELAQQFGISQSTVERVRTIMDHGTPEQIQAMTDSRGEDSDGKKIGVRTMYEQVQSDREKKELEAKSAGGGKTMQLQRENLRLINKDFRIVTKEEIPPDAVDLVLVLDFPESRLIKDDTGRAYNHIMTASAEWLKEGGMLVITMRSIMQVAGYSRKAGWMDRGRMDRGGKLDIAIYLEMRIAIGLRQPCMHESDAAAHTPQGVSFRGKMKILTKRDGIPAKKRGYGVCVRLVPSRIV